MADSTFTPAYSDDDKAKVMRIVAWLTAEPSRTGAELCRLSGIKDGTRSSILNGSYASSPSKFLDKMLAVIERSTERVEAKSDIPFTSTSIARNVVQTCYRTHIDRDFGIFVGSVGVGKTTALREYAAHNASAILVEAFEGLAHNVFIQELTLATGLPASTGAASAQIARLINSLKNTDSVILVDEANHLSTRSLGALRRISDVARIGVVLVGTKELLHMVQDPDGRFGQISSRIGFWSAIGMTISENDAQALITSYLGESVSDDILNAFYTCCEGSARALRNLLRNVWRAAINDNCTISIELIDKINADVMAGRNFKVRR